MKRNKYQASFFFPSHSVRVEVVLQLIYKRRRWPHARRWPCSGSARSLRVCSESSAASAPSPPALLLCSRYTFTHLPLKALVLHLNRRPCKLSWVRAFARGLNVNEVLLLCDTWLRLPSGGLVSGPDPRVFIARIKPIRPASVGLTVRGDPSQRHDV